MRLKQSNEILFVFSTVLAVCFGLFRSKSSDSQSNLAWLDPCVDTCILTTRKYAADTKIKVKKLLEGADVKTWCQKTCRSEIENQLFVPKKSDCEMRCLEIVKDFPELTSQRKDRFCTDYCLLSEQ